MKKLILFTVFALSYSLSYSQSIRVNNLPICRSPGNPIVEDSNRIVGYKNDSIGSSATVARATVTFYAKDLKAYILGGFTNTPYLLFNHYATVYNSGTASTQLYDDSVPIGTLFALGNSINAYYAGIDSAANNDSLTFWINNIPVLKMLYNVAQNWHMNVTLMMDSYSSVKSIITTNFKPTTGGAASDYITEVNGISSSSKIALRVTARSSSGSRQVQGWIAKLYATP